MTETAVEFHPLADIFPLPNDVSLSALADDIKRAGQLRPIVLLHGKILDGRCRFIACQRAGITPLVVDFSGLDAANFVISENVHRRHLTPSQRALAAARFVLHREATPTELGLPVGRAAELFGASVRSVHRALKALRCTDESIARAVSDGLMSVAAAAKLIKGEAARTTPPLPAAPSSASVETLLAAWNSAKGLSDSFREAPKDVREAFLKKIWPDFADRSRPLALKPPRSPLPPTSGSQRFTLMPRQSLSPSTSGGRP